MVEEPEARARAGARARVRDRDRLSFNSVDVATHYYY